jgi:hypothetical protein
MELSRHIFRHNCHECGGPALTFDESGVPLCSRHATIFIGMPGAQAEYDEHSLSMDIEASI